MFSTVLGASAGLLVRTWANGLARKRLLASKFSSSTLDSLFLVCMLHRINLILYCTAFICTVMLVYFFLTSDPWNHVAFAFIGGYIGYNLEGWEKQLLDGVNEKRKERGMPSITRQSLEISALAKEK